jgi:hypothetical protein
MPTNSPLEPYVPPAADEPLDDVQLALIALFVDLVVAEIRAEAGDEATDSPSTTADAPTDAPGAAGR